MVKSHVFDLINTKLTFSEHILKYGLLLVFELKQKNKIDFDENWFCVRIPIFFPDAFENYWEF